VKKHQQDQPEGPSPEERLAAYQAQYAKVSAELLRISSALGWALAHAHPMSTPEWRAETMIRAGWIPQVIVQQPQQMPPWNN
jgi:hypothetical protein